MRAEFVSEGVSEDILEKLKKTWEQKLKSKNIEGINNRLSDFQPHPYMRAQYNYPQNPQAAAMYMYPPPNYMNPY